MTNKADRHRSNQEWVAQLANSGSQEQWQAFSDLGLYLRAHLIRDVHGRAASLPALRALDAAELEAVADDLVQEALIRIHKNLSQYNATGSFLNFALVVARRVLISEFRKRQWTTQPIAVTSNETASEGTAVATALPSYEEIPDPKQLSPETSVIIREMSEVAYEAITNDLSDNQRIVFCDYYFYNLPLATIADNLGKTRTAIDQLMFQARTKIRRRLLQRGYGLELLDE